MVVQTGKDLGTVDKVIGTGGPIICSLNPQTMLAGVLAEDGKSHALKPKTADFFIDKDYIMYAMGLLARSEPKKALRIMKKSLVPVERSSLIIAENITSYLYPNLSFLRS